MTVYPGCCPIGDQDQVDGQALAVLAQDPGQVPGHGAVELPLGRGAVGQSGPQGQPRGLVGGGVAEALAGIGGQGDPCEGVEQERQEQPGAALGSVVVGLQVGLQRVRGVAMTIVGGERMLRWGA